MSALPSEVDYSTRVYTCQTDMPADLTTGERDTYSRAYSRACLTYVRKHGAPSVSGPVPASGPERAALGYELSRMAREHEAARHPSAHRAGLAAVNKSRKARGVEPLPTTRKPATRKPRILAAVPDVPEVVEPVAVPESREVSAYRTRKAARRELAAAMRERGEDPSDPAAWATAKREAGIR